MCLGIPGEVIEFLPEQPDLARVNVSGVRRVIKVGLLSDEPPEPVFVDGVGVPATHLHQLVLAPRLTQGRDAGGQRVRLVCVTELVDETHVTSSYSIWESRSAASSSS